jgi:hypothetical protein
LISAHYTNDDAAGATFAAALAELSTATNGDGAGSPLSTAHCSYNPPPQAMPRVHPPFIPPSTAAGSAGGSGVGRPPRPGSQRPGGVALTPLEQATAAAERCYRRSYCAALLWLFAAGRHGSAHDICPLRRWGTPPARAPVAPTAALALLAADPVMRAGLRCCLDEALAARLRPVTGCPGHYVLVPAASSAAPHHQEGSCIQGSTNYDSGGGGGLRRQPPPGPLLVRAGWGSWALRADVDGRDSCSQTPVPAKGASKRRRCGVEGWVIEVFLPEESVWIGGDCNGSKDMPEIGVSADQNALFGKNPFRHHRAKPSQKRCGLWDKVMRPLEEVSDCSDSTGSDCADEMGSAASAQQRQAPPEHRCALRSLFRAISRHAAAFFLSYPAALAAAGLWGCPGAGTRGALALARLLCTLRYGIDGGKDSDTSAGLPSFVEVPMLFAPGISLDSGLNELKNRLAVRPALLMCPISVAIASTDSDVGSIFLSHTCLGFHSGDDVLCSNAANATGSPCWLLAQIRDGSCRAALYRPAGTGPTADWALTELARACRDASRALLLRAMHASRRLDPLLAPPAVAAASFPSKSAGLGDDSLEPGPILSLESDVARQEPSSPATSTANSSEISESAPGWVCPKVLEIRVQVIGADVAFDI